MEHDSALDFYLEINHRFRTADFLVVTYTPHDEMFSDRSLATLKALQDELAQVQGVQSINSILTVPLLYSPMRSLAEQQQSTRTLLTEGVDRELAREDRKSTRLNSSHVAISYAVFCSKKKKEHHT